MIAKGTLWRSVEDVVHAAAIDCGLDGSGPLVRQTIVKMESKFYNTAADLCTLTNWATLELPPPLEHSILSQLQAERKTLSQPSDTVPVSADARSELQARTVWSAVRCNKFRPAAPSWTDKTPTRTSSRQSSTGARVCEEACKRRGWVVISERPGYRRVRHTQMKGTAGACSFVELPQEFLNSCLLGVTVQTLLSARQTCTLWRNATESDESIWRLACFHTAFVDDFVPLVGKPWFMKAAAVGNIEARRLLQPSWLQAAMKGNIEALREYLAVGVDACAAGYSGAVSADGTDIMDATALHCAVQYGMVAAVRWLLHLSHRRGLRLHLRVDSVGRDPLDTAEGLLDTFDNLEICHVLAPLLYRQPIL